MLTIKEKPEGLKERWFWYIVGPLFLGVLYLPFAVYSYWKETNDEDAKSKLKASILICVLSSIGFYNLMNPSTSEPSSKANSFSCSDPQIIHALKQGMLGMIVSLPGAQIHVMMAYMPNASSFVKEVKYQEAAHVISNEVAQQKFDAFAKKGMEEAKFTGIMTISESENRHLCHVQWENITIPEIGRALGKTNMTTEMLMGTANFNAARRALGDITYKVDIDADGKTYYIEVSGLLIQTINKELYGHQKIERI